MTRNECLSVLELPANASHEEISKAYRQLVQVWHPDRFPNNPELKDRAHRALARINEAYEFLRDEKFSSEPPPPSKTPATEWLYAKNGEQLGPVSSQQLRRMAENGELKPSDLIWREGLPAWIPASKLAGLRFATSAEPTTQPVHHSTQGDHSTSKDAPVISWLTPRLKAPIFRVSAIAIACVIVIAVAIAARGSRVPPDRDALQKSAEVASTIPNVVSPSPAPSDNQPSLVASPEPSPPKVSDEVAGRDNAAVETGTEQQSANPSPPVAAAESQTPNEEKTGTPQMMDVTAVVSPSTGMKFAMIPAGSFRLGSPNSEANRRYDETWQRTVQISRPFYLGVYEVTQSEYAQVMGTNPSDFSETGSIGRIRHAHGILVSDQVATFPVERISWAEAITFCNKLSALDGLEAAYELTTGSSKSDAKVSRTEGTGYRLPTEAEWEYACRAGTTTPFHFGITLNGDKANVDGFSSPDGTTTKGISLKRPTTVGAYAMNGFGLFDLHGNVAEMCEDEYIMNGRRWRVTRGGSWSQPPIAARSANRGGVRSFERSNNVGFRVARSGTPASPVPSVASLPSNTLRNDVRQPNSAAEFRGLNSSEVVLLVLAIIMLLATVSTIVSKVRGCSWIEGLTQTCGAVIGAVTVIVLALLTCGRIVLLAGLAIGGEQNRRHSGGFAGQPFGGDRNQPSGGNSGTVCSSCGGTGNSASTCFSCHSTGMQGSFQCSSCHGRRFDTCSNCRGAGRVF